MNGQTTHIDYAKRRKEMEAYLETHDIYNPAPLQYDIRKIYSYAQEKGVSPSELTENEMQQFKIPG